MLYYESLQEGIFDEINNIVDANNLLSKGNAKFMLGQPMYYRIYAERQFVDFNLGNFELFAKTGMMDFYAPFIFWLSQLQEDRVAHLLVENFKESKSPKINNLIKIIILLGDDAIELFKILFEKRFENLKQKPSYYYSFHSLIKSRKTDLILKALNVTKNGKTDFSINEKQFTYNDFLSDKKTSINTLSSVCLDVFNGKARMRALSRDLDFLAYGRVLIDKKDEIIKELKICLNKEQS